MFRLLRKGTRVCDVRASWTCRQLNIAPLCWAAALISPLKLKSTSRSLYLIAPRPGPARGYLHTLSEISGELFRGETCLSFFIRAEEVFGRKPVKLLSLLPAELITNDLLLSLHGSSKRSRGRYSTSTFEYKFLLALYWKNWPWSR